MFVDVFFSNKRFLIFFYVRTVTEELSYSIIKYHCLHDPRAGVAYSRKRALHNRTGPWKLLNACPNPTNSSKFPYFLFMTVRAVVKWQNKLIAHETRRKKTVIHWMRGKINHDYTVQIYFSYLQPDSRGLSSSGTEEALGDENVYFLYRLKKILTFFPNFIWISIKNWYGRFYRLYII